jgi:hypothetical protein
MSVRVAAIACALIAGSAAVSRAGLAQCDNNPPIGMMGFDSATCFGTGALAASLNQTAAFQRASGEAGGVGSSQISEITR